jgi:hypothetical protein
MEDSWHPHASITYLAKRLWINGFLAGLAVVLVICLAWLLIWGTPYLATLKQHTVKAVPPLTQAMDNSQPGIVPPSMGAALPPAATPADLKGQLEEVLRYIKEANQAKNLTRLLTFYSHTFPELSKRAEVIAHSWERCNFPHMAFTLEQVKPLPDARVFARVKWEIRVEDAHTKALKQVTRSYLVWFVNESGVWRIQALKKVG